MGRTSHPPSDRRDPSARIALFATLLGRLYYVQVLGGEEYQAPAVPESLASGGATGTRPDRGRDGATARRQPDRLGGVDDRSLLTRLSESDREKRRPGSQSSQMEPAKRVRARLVNCGEEEARAGVWCLGTVRLFKRCRWPRTCPKPLPCEFWNSPRIPPVVVDRGTVAVLSHAVRRERGASARLPQPGDVEELDVAHEAEDRSLNGASLVGRAGIEKEYDAWLRRMPGYERIAVDSPGRVLGDGGEVSSTPGATLVTSIDARVQSLVEGQLAQTIRTARATKDEMSLFCGGCLRSFFVLLWIARMKNAGA